LLERTGSPPARHPVARVSRCTWKPPGGALIFGSVDYGYGAPWSFHLHAGLPGGHVRTFFEIYKARVRDQLQARMIRRVLEVTAITPSGS
jgi:hypothetical protein